MLVNEIFRSIEGEGIRAGYPAIFIRLFGCNLGCSYCDTKYSCSGADYVEKSVNEIVAACEQYSPVKRVTITGGEPLIHQDIRLLVFELIKLGYEINIETNGSIDISPFTEFDKVIITMDWKSPNSGMNEMMNSRNLDKLRKQDVLKFVVGSPADLFEMERVVNSMGPFLCCQIFVSPVFGKINLVDIANFITKRAGLVDCRLQVQLHKIVWDPLTRGV